MLHVVGMCSLLVFVWIDFYSGFGFVYLCNFPNVVQRLRESDEIRPMCGSGDSFSIGSSTSPVGKETDLGLFMDFVS
jgi:hypothetical protein